VKPVHVLLGALFGLVLVRAGATDYAAIRGMFTLTDLQLFGVIGTAVTTLALAFVMIRRTRARTLSGAPIVLEAKPVAPGLVVGALAFGAAWALTGTCPGTALAQLGEGRLYGAFTLAGLLAGVALADWMARRRVSRGRTASSSATA
jgi:uncharacterized membrane protein YedE/YeeE